MNRSALSSGWIEMVMVLLLSASLLGVVSVTVLGRRVAPRSPAPIAVHSVPVADSVWELLLFRGHTIGRGDATDTLVVFSDYECPACASIASLLDSLPVHRARVAVLHRHFPLSIHPYAFDEALAVECAGRFGRLADGQALMYGRGGASVDPIRLANHLNIDQDRLEVSIRMY